MKLLGKGKNNFAGLFFVACAIVCFCIGGYVVWDWVDNGAGDIRVDRMFLPFVAGAVFMILRYLTLILHFTTRMVEIGEEEQQGK